jgi:hypothetical protein
VFCGFDIPGGVLFADPLAANSVQECMEQCVIPRFNVDPCYGIAFNSATHECHLKGVAVTRSTPEDDTGAFKKSTNFISGLANRQQFIPASTDCPFEDGSIQTAANGEKFKIACFKDHYGGDYHPDGWPWHTDSLEECMELCSNSTSACEAVTWNPGMAFSFSNCMPKTNVKVGDEEAALDTPLHLAFAILPDIENDCVDKSVIGADANKNFELQCNTDLGGEPTSSVHQNTLNNCLDACANANNCQGVSFDSYGLSPSI